ncbi:putative RNA-directed DNA polymerase from mobile element jockey-like [Apostichopus japonicus]|uniref:Putative RNA-directed DNA polymerase from mobile element jockey-like n=1 Tax=Stichopus japonicus TaxID=307972 RepID=A0A2G8LFQ8_STIJA|nr:putative RNA-directed DNA polymerase from mobile element jockey-like [Apostichopus japonicus]
MAHVDTTTLLVYPLLYTEKDMIDKDGYLQGMQGIKMTNEAIHDRMKTLKDSVVKSEDSVKRLVAEIKMLGQMVVQSHKAIQKEEEPGTFSSFFHLGLVLCWVDAFLSDREQSVVVNGSRSNPSKVTSGVPQGSVLGPILFLAYINDIGNAVSSGVRLFADDCVCYRVIDDVSDGHQLQEDINILGQWAKDWGMSFQPVKCKHYDHYRKRKPVIFNYMLNGVHLVKVDCVKYLGIHITSDLNWGKHIQNVCNKGNRILGVLRRNLSPCSKDAKLAAYKGLLLPVLEYASSVWDPTKLSCSTTSKTFRGVQPVSSLQIIQESLALSHLCYGT